jgi:heme/copper-type cytochrome/quinol oxidase subunit 2
VISVIVGATLAALSEGCVITQVEHLGLHDFMRAQVPSATQVIIDGEVILWLGCSAVLLVSLLSVAFVWNLRNIRNLFGVTKPIREARALQATIAHG